MGLFKSLFGGNNTPETEKEKNDKKNFEILKYDGIRAQRMGKLPYAIKCFEEAVAINDELETLRKFRDNWVSKNENGPAEIGIYYEIAPQIVEKLDCLPNSKEIYEKIYQEVVLKCVRFIEEGKEEDAYLLYKNASFDLKKYTDAL
jgi:tetratricopeptide (TPR) repeat protein